MVDLPGLIDVIVCGRIEDELTAPSGQGRQVPDVGKLKEVGGFRLGNPQSLRQVLRVRSQIGKVGPERVLPRRLCRREMSHYLGLDGVVRRLVRVVKKTHQVATLLSRQKDTAQMSWPLNA